MKLAEIHFDWNPSIPGADSRGEGLLFPLRTQSVFRADDGWSIEALGGGMFRLHRKGMPLPVVIGDGYVYVEAELPDFVTPAVVMDREEALAMYEKPKRTRKAKP